MTESAGGWEADLELGFTRRGGRTVLARNRHQGPLRLQRPLYPEPAVCHALILHPPGGVVGGDRLRVKVAVESAAAVLITTPGAAKFYRSAGPSAGQTNALRIEAGGCLEWLPQETIVYPGAEASILTRVQIDANASFMGWEVLCLGLPACGRPFSGGRFTAGLQVERRGRPIFMDRLDVEGAEAMQRPTGLRGFAVSGTFVATGVKRTVHDALRTWLDGKSETLWGLTLLDDLLVMRALGNDSAEINHLFRLIWTWLRPRVFGRQACTPRIWET